jgi:hypothetical protein
MATSGSDSEATGFQNRLFRTEIGRTPAGSVRIHVRPANPKGRFDNHRQLAACIYELAAELERRSDDLRARWAISPEAFNSRIDVELGDGDDVEAATRLVTTVLADLGLA